VEPLVHAPSTEVLARLLEIQATAARVSGQHRGHHDIADLARAVAELGEIVATMLAAQEHRPA
jgi:hypothetical protein